MIAIFTTVGLIAVTGAFSYWLLRGDKAPQARWAEERERARRRESRRLDTSAEGLMMSRVFGAFGAEEVAGNRPPEGPREVYQPPHQVQVPHVLLERAEHVARSSTTLTVMGVSSDESELPSMVWPRQVA